jgi:DNA-binding IscR family transcriptional regulator
MKRNGQFSVALHCLVHLIEPGGQPARSEDLARCIETNSVVVRRVMGRLRDAGLVESARGHGGGWTLRAELEPTTLAIIHRALGSPSMLAIALPDPGSSCLVEQSVAHALGGVLQIAERAVDQALATVTLADFARDIASRHASERSRSNA